MFELLEHRETEAEVRKIELGELPEGRTVLERSEIDPPPWRLDAADIVVGIGDSVEPAELVDAATRAGAAIGGDHRACVAGLIPPSLEIGLLGRAVAPRIYIAVETDGSFEHLTGTVKAGAIAAITGDESSPLLAAADIVLVGDWRELAPALLETLA
jgi:electron transfer flavoprotein alpha subunit